MRVYGEWAGNPRGNKENTEHCIEEIFERFRSKQCTRKRGNGPDGLLCKQHAKRQEEMLERKKAIQEELESKGLKGV